MINRWLVFSVLVVVGSIMADEPQAVIGKQAHWQYRLQPREPGSVFSVTSYDASEWQSGKAGFGYGDDDDETVLRMDKKTVLAIRHQFELSDGEDPKRLQLAIRYDDAFSVWLNGRELFSKGVETKDGKLKITSHEAEDWEYFPLGKYAEHFDTHRNCIAIVGYNRSSGSSDFTLDPQLLLLDKKQSALANQRMNKFRLVWADDPTATAIVAWNQKEGQPGTVYYGKTDHQQEFAAYPNQLQPQQIEDQSPMKTCIAHLDGLEADTEYFFCINDGQESSRRFKFRTGAAGNQPFSFIAGGDSRNGRKVRVAANRLVERLRPLFVAFTGDLVATDSNSKWSEWLDDWQVTISDDGHMTPLVPHRGNHERIPQSMHQTFGVPKDAYYAFSIGDQFFRYYALNSEIPASGKQGKWLDEDLSKHAGKVTHLVAGYHKPIRPHVDKKSEGMNPYQWADEFYRYGLDLAIESDSHVMKRTLPLKPDKSGDEGFAHSKDDNNATIYIGEGCWGAPLRAADDGKDWTVAKGSFNGFDWLHVSEEQIAVRTVRVSDPDQVESVNPEAPFDIPKGLQLWEPESGAILVVPGDR